MWFADIFTFKGYDVVVSTFYYLLLRPRARRRECPKTKPANAPTPPRIRSRARRMSVAFELSACEPESSVAFLSCQLLMERHCLLPSVLAGCYSALILPLKLAFNTICFVIPINALRLDSGRRRGPHRTLPLRINNIHTLPKKAHISILIF